MASEEVQLAWRLSVAGTEDVKARLSELHEQFNRGEITVDEYGKGLNKASSTARALGSQSQINTRLFLAQHPTINQLTRTLSGFNRVLGATVSAQNALNIASLLTVGRTNSLITLQNELAAAERDYNTALDSETKEKAARRIAELKSSIEETKKNLDEDFINRIFSFGTNLASIATSAILAAPALGAAAAGLGVFGAASIAVAGMTIPLMPLLGILGAIAVAAVLLITYWPQITEAFKGFTDFLTDVFTPVLQFIQDHWKELLIVFTGGLGALVVFFHDNWDAITKGLADAWNSITTGLSAFWEGFKTITTGAVNAIVSTVQGMVNGIISAVRSALDWLAKLPGNVASGASNFLAGSANAIGGAVGLNVTKAAAGMDEVVTGPRLILVGEGGQREHVKVTPGGRGSAEGGTTIINNYRFEGSLYTERDLESLNNRFLRNQFRRRHFGK